MLDIAYTKVTLDNGMDVIVHENHGCPIVAVNVWYHVGSKNERPGRTGFAHLFEHLMFEGSEHHQSGYFRPLQEAGGTLNGSTNMDRTNYWEVVPRDALDRALWMESDRMGYLLPALTQDKLDNQRDVVLNERRQTYENRPYGFAWMSLLAAHYPSPHPYHWPTIGYPEDVRAASLNDVHDFFSRYYHPGNASLVIAGDVNTDDAIAVASDHFSQLESGPRVGAVTASRDRVVGIKHLQLNDRVESPRLYLSWPSSSLFGEHDAELDLAADILAGGKSSRLYRSLLYDREIATDVSAHQSSNELSGMFSIVITAASGHTLSEINTVVVEEIHRVQSGGVTEEEVTRSRNRLEADFVWQCQSVGGFGGISDQLNAYNVFTKTPGFFQADWNRYESVTPRSISEAFSRTLNPDTEVALSIVPHNAGEAALPDSELLEAR